LKPIATCVPQQLMVCRPNEQLVVLVHALVNVGNPWPLAQLPAIAGGQVPPEQVPPDTHAAPCATHFTLAESQQPEPHAAPVQQVSPGLPHAVQVPSLHARPEAEQLAPAQHG
jgi:hypothetical protein